MLQPAPPKPPAREKLIDTVVGFLREIGLEVRFAPIEHETFLPGLWIAHRLREGAVAYPAMRAWLNDGVLDDAEDHDG